MRCECTLRCCSTLTRCILGCGRVPVVAQGVLSRQVKGARWQNAWCVAYFLGFDLPRIHSFEENKDELQQRGHPLAGERTYQQVTQKKSFSHSPFPFASFSASCVFLFFLHFSQFHSNRVFGVSSGVIREVLDKQLTVTTDDWQTKQRRMDSTFNTKQRKISFYLQSGLIEKNLIALYCSVFNTILQNKLNFLSNSMIKTNSQSVFCPQYGSKCSQGCDSCKIWNVKNSVIISYVW